MSRYYRALLTALPAAARVFLYHVPAYTGVPIDVRTVAELRADFGDRLPASRTAAATSSA